MDWTCTIWHNDSRKFFISLDFELNFKHSIHTVVGYFEIFVYNHFKVAILNAKDN